MGSPKNQMLLGWLAVGALSLAAGRVFYVQSIAPLRQREAVALREVAELRQRVDGARETIKETIAQERATGKALGEVDRLRGDVPAGSAMLWLPELVRIHFARSGFAVTVVRLNTVVEEPELPDYSRGYWSVGLPVDEDPKKVTELLLAVAEIEPLNTFVRVLDFAIRADPEDPVRRVGLLNVAALIRK